jgi:Rod binding domain-containing protein
MVNPVSQSVGLVQTASKTNKIETAAKQFEALMIAQMLRSAREAGSGGLGDENDSSGSTMLDVADQQFSQLLANKGGLGLSNLIVKGLNKSANH